MRAAARGVVPRPGADRPSAMGDSGSGAGCLRQMMVITDNGRSEWTQSVSVLKERSGTAKTQIQKGASLRSYLYSVEVHGSNHICAQKRRRSFRTRINSGLPPELPRRLCVSPLRRAFSRRNRPHGLQNAGFHAGRPGGSVPGQRPRLRNDALPRPIPALDALRPGRGRVAHTLWCRPQALC